MDLPLLLTLTHLDGLGIFCWGIEIIQYLLRMGKIMFTCLNCGHDDYAHVNFIGKCMHGDMKPKDGKDCNCGGMK
jgi:hypothetical protein